MFRKIGTVALISAASIMVVACDPDSAGPTANGAGPGAEAGNNTAGYSAGAATGEACGGIAPIVCGSPKDYCEHPVGQCGVGDQQGVCTTKPEVCTQERKPVCGCDDKTYGNACEAAMAGVSVKAEGECPASKT